MEEKIRLKSSGNRMLPEATLNVIDVNNILYEQNWGAGTNPPLDYIATEDCIGYFCPTDSRYPIILDNFSFGYAAVAQFLQYPLTKGQHIKCAALSNYRALVFGIKR